MGAWGTGILDNDLAEDLKEQWVEYLSEGYAPAEVSDHMIATATEDGMMEDIEEEYDFLLPFALIQWKTGRLQENIKERSLVLLEEETVKPIEGSRWEEPRELKKRLDNLQKLRLTLQSDQPKPKKISKPYYQTTSLKQGDLFTMLLKSGNYVLFEVNEIHGEHNHQVPICILYNYRSNYPPTAEQADTLGIIAFESSGPEGGKYSKIAIIGFNKKNREPGERIIIIQEHRNPKINEKTAMRMCEWSRLDTWLEEILETNCS